MVKYIHPRQFGNLSQIDGIIIFGTYLSVRDKSPRRMKYIHPSNWE